MKANNWKSILGDLSCVHLHNHLFWPTLEFGYVLGKQKFRPILGGIIQVH